MAEVQICFYFYSQATDKETSQAFNKFLRFVCKKADLFKYFELFHDISFMSIK